jgi:YD repeat-containing protein
VLKLDLYDSNGAFLGHKLSQTVSGSTDWKRVVVSMTLDEARAIAQSNGHTTEPTSMKISVGTNSKTTGTLYFDAMRWQSTAVISNIEWDTKGNYTVSEKDPQGNQTNYQRDARGNVKRVDYPVAGSHEGFGYDGLDRTTYEENGTRLGIVYKYDLNGNMTQIDYQDNGTATVVASLLNEYDELGQLTKATDQNGQPTVYKYDPNGNMTDIVHPNAKAIAFQFDALDRLRSTSFRR